MHSKIIDPHVHFFNLNEGCYNWLKGDNPPSWPNLETIKKPIAPDDLIKNCPFELAALVHIEAGFDNQQPIRELKWLNKHLANQQFRAVSFAKIDSDPVEFKKAINNLKHPSLVGIRDITEGEDSSRLLHPYTLENLAYLAEQALHFEAQFELENTLISERVAHYAQQLPHLKLVVNHAGLPQQLVLWQKGISSLAHNKNVYIKYSGFELLPLNEQQQQICFDFIVQQFGQTRVMLASNFPVCQIQQSYSELWHSHFSLCKSNDLWQQLSYSNALHFYQL